MRNTIEIRTERFRFASRDFWLAKHPALKGCNTFDFRHPRRLRAGGKPYRYICDLKDECELRRRGFLTRIETVSCCDGALEMIFVTPNAK